MKRLIFVLILFSFGIGFHKTAYAGTPGISFGSFSTSSQTDITGDLIFAKTNEPGTTLLVVSLANGNFTGSPTGASYSVTYGGVQMQQQTWSNQSGIKNMIFTLKNPPIGTNNVDATNTASARNRWEATATSYFGVRGITATTSANIAVGATGLPQVTITPTTPGSWIIDSVDHDSQPSVLSAGTGQTKVSVNNDSGGGFAGLTSYKVSTSTGSASTMYWTGGASTDWSDHALELLPIFASSAILKFNNAILRLQKELLIMP